MLDHRAISEAITERLRKDGIEVTPYASSEDPPRITVRNAAGEIMFDREVGPIWYEEHRDGTVTRFYLELEAPDV